MWHSRHKYLLARNMISSLRAIDKWHKLSVRKNIIILQRIALFSHCSCQSSASMGQTFSYKNLLSINERRTAVTPDQVDNILCIRSKENMKLAQ
jgi:hypothetical protein